MELYTVKFETESPRKIVADDMILTKGSPTTAGSKMLESYESLFEAEVLTRLSAGGYALSGKARVGEFAMDLLGESAYGGALVKDGSLVYPSAEILREGEAVAAINLDVNGAPRRAAAQSGIVCVKPTYGTVSRYGVIPVACSGETVTVSATSAAVCREVLSVISGHDEKDGTSLSEADCRSALEAKPIKKVAILKDMTANAEVSAKIAEMREALTAMGIEVAEVDGGVIAASSAAWNILMSAELCNNVSRYDGVKYGYRAESFSGIDELYTNSRTEAFGELLKTTILYGSDRLSTENYMKVYDKALRSRRVIVEAFAALFESYDAVMLPATSSMRYSAEAVSEDKYLVFEENRYTAPASVTGLPAVVFGGVQLVGRAFSEGSMLELASAYEEGKQ